MATTRQVRSSDPQTISPDPRAARLVTQAIHLGESLRPSSPQAADIIDTFLSKLSDLPPEKYRQRLRGVMNEAITMATTPTPAPTQGMSSQDATESNVSFLHAYRKDTMEGSSSPM